MAKIKLTSIQQKVDAKKLDKAKDRIRDLFYVGANINISNGNAATIMVDYFANDSNFEGNK